MKSSVDEVALVVTAGPAAVVGRLLAEHLHLVSVSLLLTVSPVRLLLPQTINLPSSPPATATRRRCWQIFSQTTMFDCDPASEVSLNQGEERMQYCRRCPFAHYRYHHCLFRRHF